MHPILATPRTLLWYALAWLLVGLVVAALLVTADWARWGNALFFAVPVSVVFGFIAPSAYYVCRSLPLARRQLVFVVAIFGAASLLSGLAWLGICVAWNAIARTAGDEWAIAISPPLAGVGDPKWIRDSAPSEAARRS